MGAKEMMKGHAKDRKMGKHRRQIKGCKNNSKDKQVDGKTPR